MACSANAHAVPVVEALQKRNRGLGHACCSRCACHAAGNNDLWRVMRSYRRDAKQGSAGHRCLRARQQPCRRICRWPLKTRSAAHPASAQHVTRSNKDEAPWPQIKCAAGGVGIARSDWGISRRRRVQVGRRRRSGHLQRCCAHDARFNLTARDTRLIANTSLCVAGVRREGGSL